MNTENMPEEEEIDRIFRQAAASYEPEFAPEAWQAMERKLDAAAPASFLRRWWKEALVLLLLIGLTGIFIYRQHANQKTAAVKTERTAGHLPSEKAVSSNKEKAELSVNNLKKQQINILTKPENIAFEKDRTAATATSPETGPEVTQPARPLKKAKTTGTGKASGKISRQRVKPTAEKYVASAALRAKPASTGAGRRESSDQPNAERPVASSADSTAPPALSSTKAEQTVPNIPGDSVAPANAAKPTAAEVAVTTPRDQAKAGADSALKFTRKRGLSKLSISLVLGPDLSTVGFVRPEKASTNIGGILSYQLSNRWVVSTGAVRARKVYGAKPSDYPSGYWQGRHIPDNINAVCQVLDIPVNLRYNFIVLPKQAVYAQTGISSYVMREEDYRYDYYNPPYSRHWVVKRKNAHLFGVANVAVGYSCRLWPGTTVGVEPFAKVPLTGIGAGKVNLISIGALFSVSYQLP